FAIDGAWTASTLRGWAIPALRSGLWNHPPGLTGAGWAVAAVILAVLLWGVAFWLAFGRGLGQANGRARLATVILAAGLLGIQLGAGQVTRRQRDWLRYMTPAFTAGPSPRAWRAPARSGLTGAARRIRYRGGRDRSCIRR
ncbi:MAG: hypothetical protein GXP48_12015, partial [Acidobacteria bacterium]|nr:hypothetical protein [Acidobacteriota bacterium]